MLYEYMMMGLAVFGAFGVVGLGWLILVRYPAKGAATYVVIPASGDGVGLEQTVAGYLRSSNLGLIRCQILIVDQGLSPLGRAVASVLINGQENVLLCPQGKVTEYIV